MCVTLILRGLWQLNTYATGADGLHYFQTSVMSLERRNRGLKGAAKALVTQLTRVVFICLYLFLSLLPNATE